MLHAFELSKLRRRSLVLMDHDAVVRDTVAAVFKEPALEALAHDLRIIDPGARSEPKVLLSLERGEYSPGHILHFDPFAFAMDSEVALRRSYIDLIANCDEDVGQGRLAAAALFFTWGSNSRAAPDDLDGAGYAGGLPGGYRDLIGRVDSSRRVVLTWCWAYYFSMLLIVPDNLRAEFATRLAEYVEPFRSCVKRLSVR